MVVSMCRNGNVAALAATPELHGAEPLGSLSLSRGIQHAYEALYPVINICLI